MKPNHPPRGHCLDVESCSVAVAYCASPWLLDNVRVDSVGKKKNKKWIGGGVDPRLGRIKIWIFAKTMSLQQKKIALDSSLSHAYSYLQPTLKEKAWLSWKPSPTVYPAWAAASREASHRPTRDRLSWPIIIMGPPVRVSQVWRLGTPPTWSHRQQWDCFSCME